jgi:hypothetical protein
MVDTCAEWTRALAYIARHGLVWYKGNAYIREDRGTYLVGESGKKIDVHDPSIPGFKRTPYWGMGDTLYQAVLDYQAHSGKGWGS